ncbi:MAG: hypothetical protein R2710_10875 [Acidimicrobiales bacterium]
MVELIGADLLLDRRPITNPVLGAAVRLVLREQPGPYARVADHQATEAALAALFAELSNVDDIGIEAIAELASSSAQHAVAYYRAIASHLTGFHTEHDLASAAADRPDLAERVQALGHVVWYLPATVTPAIGRFLDRVLHEASSASVILGVTGDADADEPVLRSCEAAGVVRPPARALEVARPATAGRIISVTDAPEEVRMVVRDSRVGGERQRGQWRQPHSVPSDRRLLPGSRSLRSHHRAAVRGLRHSGQRSRPPSTARLGRRAHVVGSPPAAGERWRRDRVMALVAGGPIGVGDERALPTTWDDSHS